MSEVMSFIGRKYKLERSENFDAYLKELGMGILLRKVVSAVNQYVELSKDGDEYTFNTVSTLKSFTIKFKLGEEFEEETPDGLKVMSVITLDGNKLIHIRTCDKPQTIIREFTDTDLIITMTVNNITCKRFYKADL